MVELEEITEMRADRSRKGPARENAKEGERVKLLRVRLGAVLAE